MECPVEKMELIGFYNRGGTCLLRGTDLVFKCNWGYLKLVWLGIWFSRTRELSKPEDSTFRPCATLRFAAVVLSFLFLVSTEGKYHMLPSGELLIRHVSDEDKYRSYQCRAVNKLTGSTLQSGGRAKFSVSGNTGSLIYLSAMVCHFLPLICSACGRSVEWAALIWQTNHPPPRKKQPIVVKLNNEST